MWKDYMPPHLHIRTLLLWLGGSESKEEFKYMSHRAAEPLAMKTPVFELVISQRFRTHGQAPPRPASRSSAPRGSTHHWLLHCVSIATKPWTSASPRTRRVVYTHTASQHHTQITGQDTHSKVSIRPSIHSSSQLSTTLLPFPSFRLE